jgi:hypothetical protein
MKFFQIVIFKNNFNSHNYKYPFQSDYIYYNVDIYKKKDSEKIDTYRGRKVPHQKSI